MMASLLQMKITVQDFVFSSHIKLFTEQPDIGYQGGPSE